MQPSTAPLIIRPAYFDRKRYGGNWLDRGRTWVKNDLILLAAAADLVIPTDTAADAFGRTPHSLAHKAREIGIWLPPSWRVLFPKPQSKRGEPLLNFNYPYVAKPDERHADLIAVNRLISRAIPGREDVCQDIMLAILESRVSLDDLRGDSKAVREFITAFRKKSFEKGGYGVESMDVTIYSPDSDGKSKYEDRKYQNSLWARG